MNGQCRGGSRRQPGVMASSICKSYINGGLTRTQAVREPPQRWPSGQDTDRYARTVAEGFLPDGRSLNREMVREGLAWWYRRYAPPDADLAHLEAEAEGARIGLRGQAELDAAVGMAAG
jgi:endonuclease YncB( thermonuclease family)